MTSQQINTLTQPQRILAGLVAYQCYNKHTSKEPQAWKERIDTAIFAAALIGVPDDLLYQIQLGDIEGLPNPARLSGGNFKSNYSFNPY